MTSTQAEARRFKPVVWQPRLLVPLMAIPADPPAQHRLHDLGPKIARLYAAARVRFAIAGPETPLTRSLVDFRGYELVDAIAEITWPAGVAVSPVDWGLSALLPAIGDAARVRTLIVGPVAALLDDSAPNFVLMTGTRRPEVTPTAFRDWWLLQHAPLVERYCFPMAGYEQLHADRAQSEALCQAFGVPFRPVDAADCVYLADVDAFFAQVGKPEVTDLLRDDELPFSDVTAGGLGMVGQLRFDSAAVAAHAGDRA